MSGPCSPDVVQPSSRSGPAATVVGGGWRAATGRISCGGGQCLEGEDVREQLCR